MKENTAHVVIGIIIGVGLSVLIKFLCPLLPTFDITPYYPQMEIINSYCEKYTSKNIAEFGVILLIIIPSIIFVVRERKKK